MTPTTEPAGKPEPGVMILLASAELHAVSVTTLEALVTPTVAVRVACQSVEAQLRMSWVSVNPDMH
jgi:hypothetical protein